MTGAKRVSESIQESDKWADPAGDHELHAACRLEGAEFAEMDYNGRNEQWRKGLALEAQVQSTRSDIIGMSFIPTYVQVIWPFLHIPAADGLGRILLHGKGMPKGDHYQGV